MKSGLTLFDFKKIKEGELSITPDRRKTLVIFTKSQETCSLKAVLRCMGGDLSAVVASASRRPRMFVVLSEDR